MSDSGLKKSWFLRILLTHESAFSRKEVRVMTEEQLGPNREAAVVLNATIEDQEVAGKVAASIFLSFFFKYKFYTKGCGTSRTGQYETSGLNQSDWLADK